MEMLESQSTVEALRRKPQWQVNRVDRQQGGTTYANSDTKKHLLEPLRLPRTADVGPATKSADGPRRSAAETTPDLPWASPRQSSDAIAAETAELDRLRQALDIEVRHRLERAPSLSVNSAVRPLPEGQRVVRRRRGAVTDLG